MSIQIAPSILAADFANLEAAMSLVANADLIHIDVMDGHFVPNLTVGQPVVKRLGQLSPLPLDVHLMIEDPDRLAPEFVLPGVSSITFHWEAARAPVRLANELRNRGVKAGLAVNPATPVSLLADLIDHVDMVLVMSVEPGFGGQSFIEQSWLKLSQARELADLASHPVAVQVDGGANLQRAAKLVSAGASVLVAGSAIFDSADPTAEVTALRRAAQGLSSTNGPKPGPRLGRPQ